eukprot:11165693-Lingulodinium_polyedra.AAC.1
MDPHLGRWVLYPRNIVLLPVVDGRTTFGEALAFTFTLAVPFAGRRRTRPAFQRTLLFSRRRLAPKQPVHWRPKQRPSWRQPM